MARSRADHPGSLPPYAVSVEREKEQRLEILLIHHPLQTTTPWQLNLLFLREKPPIPSSLIGSVR